LEEELTFCRGLSGAFPKSLFELRPEEEWLSLRTTNIIERLNKDFKSRTEPMEIVAGE